jgi:hypothetical protein
MIITVELLVVSASTVVVTSAWCIIPLTCAWPTECHNVEFAPTVIPYIQCYYPMYLAVVLCMIVTQLLLASREHRTNMLHHGGAVTS